MWLSLAFLSAALLGFYDSCKKESLRDNAVLPVLFLNTLICSLIFLPPVLLSYCGTALDGTVFKVGAFGGWQVQKWIVLKSCIVLSSWVLGYFGMKHLPLTIVGPINATRPVMVLLGAMLLFGERLNALQWTGVLLAIVSFFLLSRSGRKEGIRFSHNIWIYAIVGAAVLGAASGLYDKFLMNPDGLALDKMTVLSWYSFYQCGMMGVMLLLIWLPARRQALRAGTSANGLPVGSEPVQVSADGAQAGRQAAPHFTPFRWKWSIVLISLFLTTADFVYMYALSMPGAMISIVSMVRRGSVVVSFLFAALVFKEKNLRSKALDLALVLLGMVFLYLGSR